MKAVSPEPAAVADLEWGACAKRPAARFRVRTLMILVAMVAATLWSIGAARRWSHCRWRAECHARAVAQYRADSARYLAQAIRDPKHSWNSVHLARRTIPAADHHAGQAAMFERAMWRPWNPIPVESGEPEAEGGTPEPPDWRPGAP